MYVRIYLLINDLSKISSFVEVNYVHTRRENVVINLVPTFPAVISSYKSSYIFSLVAQCYARYLSRA